MRNIRRDEERFTFAHQMIDNAIAFTDANLDVAFELEEKLLRINLMKIVSSVRAHDDHDKKIAAIVNVAIAHRRLEEMAVLFDPLVEVERRLHRRSQRAGLGSGGWRFSKWSDKRTIFRRRGSVKLWIVSGVKLWGPGPSRLFPKVSFSRGVRG